MHRGGKEKHISYMALKNKKGLSNVITNLLIILLVLVSMGVVWVVIRNIIGSGTSEVEIGQFLFDIDIESAYVSGADVVVTVRRNSGGGDLEGMAFIFENKTSSITLQRTGALQESDLRTFIFASTEIPGIAAGDKVSVAPVYTSAGEERTANPTDTRVISATPPPGSGGGTPGGTGGTGGTPECSDGSDNDGDGNVDLVDSGCVDSSDTDETNCGDNICEGGENSETCSADCPVSGNPECSDGSDNDGDGNVDLVDSGCVDSSDTDETNCGDGVCEGGENTASCSLDCEVEIPSSCNGTWEEEAEDPEVECDGTPLPNGCTISCTCDTGFTSNGAGSCDLNPPLNSGTINDVWINIFFNSNDLPKDSTVSSYIGDYVNFSGSSETGCFQITFAGYVPSNDISYLRVSDSPPEGAPTISSGEGYSIWEAENCGQ